MRALESPFISYVGNQLRQAQNHYHGLREALPALQGIAILDEPGPEPRGGGLECLAWRRREIENYLSSRATLESYAIESARAYVAAQQLGPLFEPPEIKRRVTAMNKAINEVESALERLDRGSPWDPDTKVSDEFLNPLFKAYFEDLGLPNLMNKRSFYELVEYVPDDEIDAEITEKLDAIAHTAEAASPVEQP